MKSGIYILVFAFIFLSCGASKQSATPEQIAALEDLVKNRKFTIHSDWAYPRNTFALQQVLNSGLLLPGSGSGAINLTGNTNFLTVSGDSISSFLPYFGERQMQVGFDNNDSAIRFDGLLKDLTTEKDKKNRYIITFQAMSMSENFNGTIILFPNFRSEIILNGMGRFPIRYTGVVVEKDD